MVRPWTILDSVSGMVGWLVCHFQGEFQNKDKNKDGPKNEDDLKNEEDPFSAPKSRNLEKNLNKRKRWDFFNSTFMFVRNISIF